MAIESSLNNPIFSSVLLTFGMIVRSFGDDNTIELYTEEGDPVTTCTTLAELAHFLTVQLTVFTMLPRQNSSKMRN